MEEPFRRLVGGGAWSLLLQTGGAGLLLATDMVLARLLGAGEFGGYAWAASMLLILGNVGLVGLNQLILRRLPVYLMQGQMDLASGLARFALVHGLAGSCLLALAGMAVVGLLPVMPYRDLLVLALAGVPLVALLNLLQAMLRSIHRIREALAPDVLFRPAWLLAVSGCIWWLAPEWMNAVTAMGGYLTGTVLACLLMVILLRHALRLDWWRSGIESGRVRWGRTALSLAALNLLTLLQSRLDLILVGMLLSPDETGYYAAALRLASLLVFPLGCLNIVAASLISTAHADGGREAVQRIVDTINLGMLLTTIPLSVLLVVTGPWLLLLFGEGFEQAYPAFLILVGGQAINAMCGSVGLVMAMTGQELTAVRILAGTTLVSMALCLVLIPHLGAMGAAMASALTTALWNILMLVHLRSSLGLRWRPLGMMTGKSA